MGRRAPLLGAGDFVGIQALGRGAGDRQRRSDSQQDGGLHHKVNGDVVVAPWAVGIRAMAREAQRYETVATPMDLADGLYEIHVIAVAFGKVYRDPSSVDGPVSAERSSFFPYPREP